MKKVLFITIFTLVFIFNMSSAQTSAQTLLNEVDFNDWPYEYVEIRVTPGAALNNLYFLRAFAKLSDSSGFNINSSLFLPLWSGNRTTETAKPTSQYSALQTACSIYCVQRRDLQACSLASILTFQPLPLSVNNFGQTGERTQFSLKQVCEADGNYYERTIRTLKIIVNKYFLLTSLVSGWYAWFHLKPTCNLLLCFSAKLKNYTENLFV